LRGQETHKDSQPRLRPSIQPRPRSASVGLQDDPRKLTFDRTLLRQELRDLEVKDPVRFSGVIAETLKRADVKRYVEFTPKGYISPQ
jgi:hypothetical protein